MLEEGRGSDRRLTHRQDEEELGRVKDEQNKRRNAERQGKDEREN